MLDFSSLVIPGITKQGDLARVSRARTFKYYCQLVEEAISGKCTFCSPKNQIIMENDFFVAWNCTPPEKYTRLHFLIVPKRHVIDSSEFTDAEILALQHLKNDLKAKYGYECSGDLTRNNAPLMAGTQEHWHTHVMIPDGTGRVESPFCKGDESEKRGLARAIIWEKVRVYISRVENATEESAANMILTQTERDFLTNYDKR